MYIFSKRFNAVEMWRGVVERNVELFQRIAHKVFLPGEICDWFFDPDRCGMWFAVRSTERPEELLSAIQREAFSTFAFLGVHFDGQQHWTHFRALA